MTDLLIIGTLLVWLYITAGEGEIWGLREISQDLESHVRMRSALKRAHYKPTNLVGQENFLQVARILDSGRESSEL